MKPPRQFKARLYVDTEGWSPRLVIIILVLFLAALFFSVFRIVPYASRTTAQEPELEVFMISPSDMAEEYGRNITGWSMIENPTIMSQPHPKLGFSILKQYPPSLPFADQEPLSLLWPPRKYIEMPIEAPNFLPESALKWRLGGENWRVFLPKGRKFAQQPLPQKVIWRLPNGRTIENPPDIELDIIQEKAKDTELTQPTILEIIAGPDGENYRVIARESCGNSELDQLAVEALRNSFFEKREVSEPENNQQETISRVPRPMRGTSTRIEVEWRLVTSSG